MLYVHVNEKLAAEQINKLAIVDSRFQSFHISQGQKKNPEEGQDVVYYFIVLMTVSPQELSQHRVC